MYASPRNSLLEKNMARHQSLKRISRFVLHRLFPPAPTVARIETTNRCNLACRMCLHQSLKKMGDMDFKTYKKIMDILPSSVEYVNPSGFGEPLLHKNIIEMVRLARFKHKFTEVFTNATVLDAKMSKNLLSSGLNSIHFSVDGTTRKTYEYLRLGANYDTVIQNITEFMSLRKKIQDPPKVTMRVVLWRDNIYETSDFIELANTLGINNVLFQSLQHFWGAGLSKPDYSIHYTKEIEQVKQTLKNAQEKAEKMGIQLKLPVIDFGRKIRCSQPWFLIFINWQGFVKPCCAVYNIDVGNILNQSFKEIWKGPKLMTWRRQMKTSSPPIQCRNCCDR